MDTAKVILKDGTPVSIYGLTNAQIRFKADTFYPDGIQKVVYNNPDEYSERYGQQITNNCANQVKKQI